MTLPEHLSPSDIRGIAQLATQATTGVTRIAEGVHQSVWHTLGVPDGPEPGLTRGITGLVYASVRGVTHMVGKSVDVALAGLQRLSDVTGRSTPDSPQREMVLAALNGVMGDHLVSSNNPLATSMTLRHQGKELSFRSSPAIPGASAKVLLLIHGLCMSDLHWRARREGLVVDHGEALASALGCTPIHVRYNSGLHTSQNGRELSALLEQLIGGWPVTPCDELTVVAHSMGGLVMRSAVHCAEHEGHRWPRTLRNIVFLGTPHHGAPLEKAGHWVDTILASTRYTAPFATLGHLRSAGITDLRYGHVVDEDWRGRDRFDRQPDARRVVPLPRDVACFSVAATTASENSALANHLIGDGLVPLRSALGQHDDTRRDLGFAAASQRILYRTNHVALLSSPEVTRQIVNWLGPDADRQRIE